jgi:hypothetical protein
MNLLTQILVIYCAIGAMIAVLMWLGVARIAITMHILNREVDPRFAKASILSVAGLLWPVVIWSLIVGKRRERVIARAEKLSTEDMAKMAHNVTALERIVGGS